MKPIRWSDENADVLGDIRRLKRTIMKGASVGPTAFILREKDVPSVIRPKIKLKLKNNVWWL